MTRQRLSREQSREQTRERLLEASHKVFNEKGLALTSVEDITTAAGYSRGAFYSNFDDKTELFFELLRRESAGIDQEFHRLLGAPPEDPARLQEVIADYYSELAEDDKCSLLWMEARIVALRDEKFRARLNVFLEERYRQIAEFVEIYSRLTATAPAAPPREIAIGLMALCEGVGFAHRCDPTLIDQQTARAVLSWFLKASIQVPAPAPVPASAGQTETKAETETETEVKAKARAKAKPKPAGTRRKTAAG